METEPIISIIIPVYNVEKYVKECLESVKGQTYNNLEVIIVNDGATDSSRKICKEFLNDRRFLLFDKTNGGLSDARNYGIEKATGEYLFFLDSDDYISRNCIEILYKAIIKDDSDIASAMFCQFSEKSIKKNISINSKYECLNRVEAMAEMINDRKITTTAWGKLYKKSLFKELRFIKGKCHEDIFIMHHLYDLIIKTAIINDVVYFYRYNPESITRKTFTLKRQDAVEAEKRRTEFILEKYEPLSDIQIKKYVWVCLFNNLSMIKSKKIKKYKNIFIENSQIISKYIDIFLISDASIKAKGFAITCVMILKCIGDK